MPKRNAIVQVSTPCQGDDAWVRIKPPTVGEIRAIYKAYGVSIANESKNAENTDSDRNIELTDELVRRFIVDWNWVDGDGKPLPQIRDMPNVIDQLLPNELMELVEAITEGGTIKKNKTT